MERRLSRRDAARKVGAFAIISSLGLIPFAPARRAAFAQAAATATTASGPFASLGLQTLTLKVSDKGVEGMPTTLTAGRYVMHLEPSPMLGQGDNQTTPGVFSVLLPKGVTFDDVVSVAATPATQSEPPDWFYTTTVPGGVSGWPNMAADAVVDFTAGDWFASAPNLSTPPVSFTVAGDMPKDLPTPASNATITFKDYSITLTDGALKAGDNVITFTNEGKLPHFLFLAKGPDTMTLDQVGAYIMGDATGTPAASGGLTDADFQPVMSTIDQSGGTTQWNTATLEAGTYAGMCWIPEPITGVPHAAMGMYNVFTVK